MTKRHTSRQLSASSDLSPFKVRQVYWGADYYNASDRIDGEGYGNGLAI